MQKIWIMMEVATQKYNFVFQFTANCVIIFLLIFTIPLFSQENKLFEITPSAGLKYFYWGEYHSQDIQDLEEYGLIYSGNISSKIKFSKSLQLYTYPDLEFYYGIINYNGYLQTSNGTTEPYKNETKYWGLEFVVNMGYDIWLGEYFILSPECGVGYEYWNRNIDNGGQYGYEEIWDFFYLDFGSNFTIPLRPSSKIFLKILGKYPLIISESVDLASRGQGRPANINLEPGSNIGINLELGAVIYGAHLSFYLEYLLFSSSVFDQGYNQPRSDRSLTGLKLGYAF